MFYGFFKEKQNRKDVESFLFFYLKEIIKILLKTASGVEEKNPTQQMMQLVEPETGPSCLLPLHIT